MKKPFWVILAVSITVLITGAGTYIAYGQGNPPAPPPPPPLTPRMPPPPDSNPSEEQAASYALVPKESLPGLGIQLPRELTAQEKEKIIQIALKVTPVSERINQGYSFHSEPGWMSYQPSNKTIPWGFLNIDNKVKQANPQFIYFPAVKIGLGTPQQFEVNVAVDSSIEEAVYAVRMPDKRVASPPYVQYLTEEQRAKITAIALETEEVKKYIGGEYKIEYRFWAISKSGGYLFTLEYDIVSKGIPDSRYKDIEDNSMKIYPAVFFKSENWMVEVVVDLETEKVVHTDVEPVRRL